MTTKPTEIDRLHAQVEIMRAALARALEVANWQAKTNTELNELLSENKRLRDAMQATIDENGHLADGDDCTLIHLKRALPPNA